MDAPKPGQSSSVYLQIEFPGPSQLQCNVIAVRSPTGVLRASAQNRVMKDDGRFEYLSLRQDQVDEVRRMRMARRGKQLYFLYAHDVSQPDRLLGRYVVPDEESAALFTRLMVHTGGAERVTEAAWKKLSIHAEKVTPVQ